MSCSDNNTSGSRWAGPVYNSRPAGGYSLRPQSGDPVMPPRLERVGPVQPLERQMEMERIRREFLARPRAEEEEVRRFVERQGVPARELEAIRRAMRGPARGPENVPNLREQPRERGGRR